MDNYINRQAIYVTGILPPKIESPQQVFVLLDLKGSKCLSDILLSCMKSVRT